MTSRTARNGIQLDPILPPLPSRSTANPSPRTVRRKKRVKRRKQPRGRRPSPGAARNKDGNRREFSGGTAARGSGQRSADLAVAPLDVGAGVGFAGGGRAARDERESPVPARGSLNRSVAAGSSFVSPSSPRHSMRLREDAYDDFGRLIVDSQSARRRVRRRDRVFKAELGLVAHFGEEGSGGRHGFVKMVDTAVGHVVCLTEGRRRHVHIVAQVLGDTLSRGRGGKPLRRQTSHPRGRDAPADVSTRIAEVTAARLVVGRPWSAALGGTGTASSRFGGRTHGEEARGQSATKLALPISGLDTSADGRRVAGSCRLGSDVDSVLRAWQASAGRMIVPLTVEVEVVLAGAAPDEVLRLQVPFKAKIFTRTVPTEAGSDLAASLRASRQGSTRGASLRRTGDDRGSGGRGERHRRQQPQEEEAPFDDSGDSEDGVPWSNGHVLRHGNAYHVYLRERGGRGGELSAVMLRVRTSLIARRLARNQRADRTRSRQY